MTTLIKNGILVDPANRVFGKLNLLLEDDKISLITTAEPFSDRVYDARNKIVCPGFIDIHMHEDPVENGVLYSDPEKSIFSCMLRMGVTTAVGGNCGDNACDPAEYLDIVDRDGAYVNVALFAGHSYFRYRSGVSDKYAPAPEYAVRIMTDGLSSALHAGCCGISYGIRYIPGITGDELRKTAAPCAEQRKPIAAHVRDDAEAVFSAAAEFLDTAAELGIPAQFSHIGSMAGFGQMEDFLRLVESYRLNGLDVACDCYPYSAFSTSIGSTTYDDGWLERYLCDYSALELCEGAYRGMRCTEDLFRKVRREFPECETICYVMKEEDISRAVTHPMVMLGSDGVLSHGQGHPRAAGAFPRFLASYVRTGRISLYDAIEKMTSLPASRLGLTAKGRLNCGADADIVIFDPTQICDRATFENPITPPIGISAVYIRGQLAMEDGRILCSCLGRSVRVR